MKHALATGLVLVLGLVGATHAQPAPASGLAETVKVS